jgi:putative hemolysin
MKLLLTAIAILLLQGCLYQSVDITDIKKADQYCSTRGGVKAITVHAVGPEFGKCVNGDVKRLEDVKLIVGVTK